MVENSGSSDSKGSQKLKKLILQGMIGAVSLAGATAIPLVVQRFLAPTPVASPVTPAPQTSSVQSPNEESSEQEAEEDEQPEESDEKRRGRDKQKRD